MVRGMLWRVDNCGPHVDFVDGRADLCISEPMQYIERARKTDVEMWKGNLNV